jgi:hypothetical protein
MVPISTSLTTVKPFFNQHRIAVQQPDNIERILLLIEGNVTKPFPEEISELNLGLELLGKILDDMKIIEDAQLQ